MSAHHCKAFVHKLVGAYLAGFVEAEWLIAAASTRARC